MKKTILEIQNLTKYYGKILGVENLSLKLEEGEIFGFIGPNGAGKSTTIRSIMNLINKTSGRVLVENKEFNKDDTDIKEKIGYLPSEIHLYDDLTVKEMLDYHESFYKKSIHKRRIELVKRLELDEKKKIEDLSLGNLKKLGIVLAFMHNPKILILDEPTSGLDPIMQNVFYDLLKEEKAKGNTIFYSTHILNEVSKICDRVGIIRNGKLIKVEKIEELSKKNLTFVTITSNEMKDIVNNLKVNVILKESNTIKFGNNLPHNELIKKLSKYNIERILIEEATLEDMFLHYYK
ncbi:MAG: ABC transporter ATP-binding protein [Bacilli bacterium]